jgi:putative transposase
MIRVLLNREGWKVGKDLVYRLYKEVGLGLRKRPAGKRRTSVHRQERMRPTGPNQVWTMDFVADQLSDGRRIRSLTIVDIFTRESLAIEVGPMMDLWAYKNEAKIDFSRPGKPTDNAFCESFNGTFCSECLDTNWFSNLEETKRIIEAWRREYNVSCPHRALDYRPSSWYRKSRPFICRMASQFRVSNAANSTRLRPLDLASYRA